jgi:acyl-coenzyme A synthetase/AMP-(fatty) acid ligase
MPGARWFPESRLNFADNLLRCRDETDAIVFRGEDKVRRRLSHGDLYAEVSRLAQALRDIGVATGDRVGGYLPNIPESVIAMLATTSIGAIWIFMLARFRHRSDHRPLRANPAEGSFYRRRLPLQRQNHRLPGARKRG